MPALVILRLARTRRCAMVGSGTKNALAICGVVIPTTARSVKARRASTFNAGWQQPNNIGSRSSLVRAGASSAGVASGSHSSAKRASRERFRSKSMARRRAASDSQPPGLAGTPSRRQVRSAMMIASCTASSAISKLPRRRCSWATIRPASRRTMRASAASSAARGSAVIGSHFAVIDYRPDLHRNARQLQRRPFLHDGDRRIEIGDIDYAEAADILLRLGERTIHNHRLAAIGRGPNRGSRLGSLQLGTRIAHHGTMLFEPAVDRLVNLGPPFLGYSGVE